MIEVGTFFIVDGDPFGVSAFSKLIATAIPNVQSRFYLALSCHKMKTT